MTARLKRKVAAVVSFFILCSYCGFNNYDERDDDWYIQKLEHPLPKLEAEVLLTDAKKRNIQFKSVRCKQIRTFTVFQKNFYGETCGFSSAMLLLPWKRGCLGPWTTFGEVIGSRTKTLTFPSIHPSARRPNTKSTDPPRIPTY